MEMKEIFLMQSSTACVQMQRFLNHKGRMSLYEERQWRPNWLNSTRDVIAQRTTSPF
jgi:hypothetical protein